MRNVWKGLVVGGLTGVAAGLLLDALEGAGQRTEQAGRALRRQAPELFERARQVAEAAADAITAAGLGEKGRRLADEARRVADEAAEAIRSGDLGEKARHVAELTVEKAQEIDLADKAERAADRARDAGDR